MNNINKKKLTGLILMMLVSVFAHAEVTIKAPTKVHAGDAILIEWQGPNESGDFITLVTEGTKEGNYQGYTYLSKGRKASLIAHAKPGNYELRYVSGKGYKTLATQELVILSSNSTLTASSTAKIGETIVVEWSGPNASGDFISVVNQGAKEGDYLKYTYTSHGNPAKLRIPLSPGDYELRYSSANGYATLASMPLKVITNQVTVSSVTSALSGATVSVRWDGPDSEGDFISAAKKGAKNGTYETYAYLRGNPISLTLPEGEGEYEIRYASGDGYQTLATSPITLLSTKATMKVIGEVYTNRNFKVEWQGPNNARDYITIVKLGAKEKSWQSYTYTNWGNPLLIEAPKEPGDYELRYAAGGSYSTLGRLSVKVLASKNPGRLKVKKNSVQTTSLKSENSGVSGSGKSDSGKSDSGTLGLSESIEIILDASGSMLKKENGQRRIDIAKQALESLIKNTLNENSAVALRAFGHIKADTCDGELVLPLSPLDKDRALKTINGIYPKNLAKTPIADSLKLVEKDLANVSGIRKVILVTDGEETCGGDPEATIQEMLDKGIELQLNIVGFAIDDFGLKNTFTRWAQLGNGRYFDAQDKTELETNINEAMKEIYQILDSKDSIITSGTVNGEWLELLPGAYTIKLNEISKPIEIRSEKETIIVFD